MILIKILLCILCFLIIKDIYTSFNILRENLDSELVTKNTNHINDLNTRVTSLATKSINLSFNVLDNADNANTNYENIQDLMPSLESSVPATISLSTSTSISDSDITHDTSDLENTEIPY